jgi:trigger factor
VLIDRTISAGGESSVVEDFSYEVGSGLVTPEMDDHLRGAKTGDILKFDVHHEQLGDTSFTILVKEVREKVLPDLTDEWANEASEFDTVDELRANYRQELEAVRRLEAALSVRDKVIEALIELVDDEIPEALVAPEMERRLNQLSHRLSHQGVDLRSFLQSVGDSQDEFVTQLRTEATNAVKADLALRAVADLEGVEVAEEEVDKEIEEIGRQRKISPAAVRRELENEDNLPAVRSGIRKTKALEWLIAHTEFVDEEGQVIDRSQLTAPNFDAPDTAVAADAAVAEETVE